MAIITHYTSLQVLVNHVLEKNSFRLNSLSAVKDPYEYTKRYASVGAAGDFTKKFSEAMALIEDILPKKFKVGCFVAEDGDDDNPGTWKSILNAPLWAHHGDNNQGVAIVFDSAMFQNECRTRINHPWALHADKVTYPPSLRSDEDPYSVNLDAIGEPNYIAIAEYLFKRSISFWFKKGEQWAYENEYRVMLFNEEIGSTLIPIKNSLKAIVFGERVSRVVLNTIGQYCHNEGVTVLALRYDDLDNCYSVNNVYPE